MQSETGHVRLVTRARHRPVHRLDDVAADAEVAQRRLEARLQLPSRRTDLLGEPKPFELARSPDHQPLQFGVFSGAAGAEVDHAAALIGDVAQRAIEAGPALGLDLLLQGGPDFLLGARAELQGNPLGGAVAESLLDVVAADDEIRAVVGAPAHQHMDVRIVRVPVIDGDPVEFRAEIALGVSHQLAGEGAKIGHLGRVLGGHREPEVMAVVLATLGERPGVGVVGPGVEHPGVRAVAGDAFALEIGDMLRQRRRAELRSLMADDPRHDDDAPTAGPGRQRQGGASAAPERRAPCGAAAPAERVAAMAGLLRGPHHLANEGLRTLGALVAVADAAGPDMQVVVARRHGCTRLGKWRRRRSDR